MHNVETMFGPLLGVADVATALGVSRTTVVTLVRRGDLPAARVGRQIRIPERVVIQYLRNAGLDVEEVCRNGGRAATAAPVSVSAHAPTEERPDTGVTVR